jgi:hypothetical protein
MSAGFGPVIAGGLRKLKEMRVSRHLAPAFILAAALAPASAHAQVNIDQDKSPAHIFSSDCAVCHKTTRGLANGRGSSALTGFLAEHYTSSREEAASVAAYVLSAGGGVGTAAPVRDAKPDSARGRAAAAGQEPKTESKPEPKTRRAAKPEEQPGAGTKPRRTAREHAKPREERSASVEPSSPAPEKKPVERGGPAAAARAHNQPKPAEEAAPPKPEAVPAAVTAAAKPVEPVKPEATPMSPAASAPARAQPAAASPAPTDNIPD